MEDSEGRQKNVSEVDIVQDCKMSYKVVNTKDTANQDGTINDTSVVKNVSINSVQTAVNDGVSGGDFLSLETHCKEECSGHLEGHFHECCVLNAADIARENIKTEIVSLRVESTKERCDVAETTVSSALAHSARNREDLTLPKKRGKRYYDIGERSYGVDNLSEGKIIGNPRKESRNALCNYHSFVKNKVGYSKEHTSERSSVSRSTTKESVEDNTTKSTLHNQENPGIKTTSIDNNKNQNIVGQNLDKTWDPFCSFCSQELEVRKLYQKKHLRDGTMKEKLQTVASTDLMQPMSAASTSNKSTTSRNVSAGSERKQRSKKEYVAETDPVIISRRQKQIDYGKNTTGYQRYKEAVPKDQRRREDPHTPPKCEKFSRRGWDGLIRSWRRKLHDWDPPRDDASDDERGSLMSLASILSSSDGSENVTDMSEPATKKFLLTKDLKTNVLENRPNAPE